LLAAFRILRHHHAAPPRLVTVYHLSFFSPNLPPSTKALLRRNPPEFNRRRPPSSLQALPFSSTSPTGSGTDLPSLDRPTACTARPPVGGRVFFPLLFSRTTLALEAPTASVGASDPFWSGPVFFSQVPAPSPCVTSDTAFLFSASAFPRFSLLVAPRGIIQAYRNSFSASVLGASSKETETFGTAQNQEQRQDVPRCPAPPSFVQPRDKSPPR